MAALQSDIKRLTMMPGPHSLKPSPITTTRVGLFPWAPDYELFFLGLFHNHSSEHCSLLFFFPCFYLLSFSSVCTPSSACFHFSLLHITHCSQYYSWPMASYCSWVSHGPHS